MKNPTILICGGGEEAYKSLLPAFEEENLGAVYASNGAETLALTRHWQPDAAVLDAGLLYGPDEELFARTLRASRTVTIVRGRSGGEEEEIYFLRSGADDYIQRSTPPRVTAARVCAALRRRGISREEKSIKFAEMTIYPESFRISLLGKEIELIPSDFRLLCCLAENAGKVLTREQLQNVVWGYEYCGSPRAVDTQIKRLRKALAVEKPHFAIQTVYGVGYKLDLTPDKNFV